MRSLIPFATLTVALCAGAFPHRDRIVAWATDSCYQEVGGVPLVLDGVVPDCFIQNFGSDRLWVFVSDDRVFFTICGSRQQSDAGFTFVHFTRGESTPFVSALWFEACDREPDYWQGEPRRAYAETTSRYAVSRNMTQDTVRDYDDVLETLRVIRDDYETADQIVVTKAELDALVRRYRSGKP